MLIQVFLKQFKRCQIFKVGQAMNLFTRCYLHATQK